MHYFLNIGSNLGQTRLNISRALAALNRNFGPIDISHAVESEPWGFESPNTFLNVGVHIVSELPPLEVLDILQGIERELSDAPHRTPEGKYTDRIIDIDIMAADTPFEHERLTIPHPHLTERLFFTGPLAEIAPNWRHPATGQTIAEIHRELELKSNNPNTLIPS